MHTHSFRAKNFLMNTGLLSKLCPKTASIPLANVDKSPILLITIKIVLLSLLQKQNTAQDINLQNITKAF